MDNKSTQLKIQKTLLGKLTTDLQIVVITPIISAFNKLNTKLQIFETHNNGFFHNSCFQTKNGLTGMLINIPQGIGAQDVMYTLSDVDVIFYGYAGSLLENIEIGTIVEVKTAIAPDGTQFPLNVTGTYDSVICGYSPCLLGNMSSHHCEKARLAGCQVMDMETVYCAYAAIQNMNRFTAQLVVSDIPGLINFWDLNKNVKVYFRKRCATAIDNIVLYLNS
jgi:hypothetical protein